MRLFIAAILPENIRYQLSNYISSLRDDIDGVKWEKLEKLHITLKFLGDVEDEKVGKISTLLEHLVIKYHPFKINLSAFGGFPRLKNPRVLFVGLSENDEFANFYRELDQGLSEVGFDREVRKFLPHVTIGRVKKRISVKDSPGITKTPFEITQVGIIKSELKPQGSVYTPLKIFNLDE